MSARVLQDTYEDCETVVRCAVVGFKVGAGLHQGEDLSLSCFLW